MAKVISETITYSPKDNATKNKLHLTLLAMASTVDTKCMTHTV